MSWIDIVTLALIVVVIAVYVVRGRDAFGTALFDTGAAVVAAWAAHTFYKGLSAGIGLSSTATYIILFVVLGAALFFASARLFNFMQLSFSPFNTILSFICGFVSAWAFAFVLLDIISSSVGPNSPTAELVMESSVATEILQFRTITGTKERLDRTHFAPIDLEQGVPTPPGTKNP
jgi:hypothetical protein